MMILRVLAGIEKMSGGGALSLTATSPSIPSDKTNTQLIGFLCYVRSLQYGVTIFLAHNWSSPSAAKKVHKYPGSYLRWILPLAVWFWGEPITDTASQLLHVSLQVSLNALDTLQSLVMALANNTLPKQPQRGVLWFWRKPITPK